MDENEPGEQDQPAEQLDKRIDALADRLGEELVDESGTAEPQHVSDVVHASARSLEDAPIQTFVPLLVENESLDELRAEGFHRVRPTGVATHVDDPDGDTTVRADVPDAQ